MFGNFDKILIKYFKRKKESPLASLIKLMRKDKGIETQEVIDKEGEYNE
jgi:hypothetical protein|tara:strand:- start:116 stop:262 length:147 start_codon:yes stop_codon:yes gene_type:complete